MMFARCFVILLSGWLLAPSAPPAVAATLADVVRVLERPFQAATPAGGRVEDYRADFTQEARIASLDRTQQARGRVSVRFDYRRAAPEPIVMFHWEYSEPSRQELICDGKTLWVYLPENNQVIQSELDAMPSGENNPMTFLTGLGNLSRDFQVSFAEPARDSADNYVLELRPRRATPLLERMRIVVRRAAVETPGGSVLQFPILSTAVFDPSGNSTLIVFDKVRINQRIPADQFSFIPPAGAEVVRPTGQQ
jgi:outer membrane lipoprotein carrier protein